MIREWVRLTLVAGAAAMVLAPIGASAQEAAGQDKAKKKINFILIREDGKTTSHGNWNSAKVREFKEKGKGERLFVERDDKWFMITDRETIKQVDEAWKPVNEQGKKMGALGRQMGEVGREQGQLGRQMGELGRQIGELARQSIGAKDDERRDIEAKQNEVSAKMEALGREMETIGKKNEPLGKQMEVLGKEMKPLVEKAEVRFVEVVDAAFTKGLAVAVP